jgi:hypothetical protein
MQNKKLKSLQAKWYAKLKKSGFEDIENGSDNPMLLTWETNYFYKHYGNRPDVVAAKFDYYLRASHLLNRPEVFENEFEKLVWEKHSEGTSIREMAKQLASKKNGTARSLRDRIAKIINKLSVHVLGGS